MSPPAPFSASPWGLCGCVCVSLSPTPPLGGQRKEVPLVCTPRTQHRAGKLLLNGIQFVSASVKWEQYTPCLHPGGSDDGHEARSLGLAWWPSRCRPRHLTVSLPLLLPCHRREGPMPGWGLVSPSAPHPPKPLSLWEGRCPGLFPLTRVCWISARCFVLAVRVHGYFSTVE